MEEVESTHVIIAGAGPTGALLSALLSRYDVPHIVLERERKITTDPRGIALDEEGIRWMQGIGMYYRIFSSIGLCQDMRFINDDYSDLAKLPFLRFNLLSSDGGTGHVAFLFHKQPELEKAIRDAIKLGDSGDVRLGCELLSVSENESHVVVEYKDGRGANRRVKAAFLVGADGRTGYIRKKYLEPKGITLEKSEGYDETWVALNWKMTLPTSTSHPDFPLWKLGYSPEQVYDLFFPQEFRFLCKPERPAVCGRFGRPEDRLWRFEFVVKPDEDGTRMAEPCQISSIVHPYITHAGKRYGLHHDVQYPLDCIKTLRCRPFRFSARSCNKWALGRCMLVGDAAHIFPPFGGQGIASGFRDASSLAWRLVLLHRRPRSDYEPLLKAWYTERKQQLERSLALTVRNGAFLTNHSPWQAYFREWVLGILQHLPYFREVLERGPRADGMISYVHSPGLPFLPELGGGRQLPQVYARDLREGHMLFSDDMIFRPRPRGLLPLLILADTADVVDTAFLQLIGLSDLSQGLVDERETTVLIHDLKIPKLDRKSKFAGIARIASGEEFASDKRLCLNRPAPQNYDPYLMRKELGPQVRFILLRPDRFIYAACSSIEEVKEAVGTLRELLFVRRSRQDNF